MIDNDSLTFFFAVILTKKKEYLRIYSKKTTKKYNKNSKFFLNINKIKSRSIQTSIIMQKKLWNNIKL